MANSYLFQDQPQTGNALPTGQLANIARDQESAFTQTAPSQGYLAPQMSNQLPAGIDPSKVNEGWVKGYLASQDNQRQNIESNINQNKLNMLQERQGWDRTDREQKRAIDDGMVNAIQNGGFEGVVDYLKGVDPDRAMQFQQAKDKMDQSMMQTNIFKAALPNEYAKILTEGYGIIGKMGQAILNAKPEDRANMYKNILPIIKTVNPNAPDTLNMDATHMFMLGAAQATPENELFLNVNRLNNAQSELGKLMQDKQILASQGKDTSVIDQRIQKYKDDAQQAHLGLMETRLRIASGATTEQQKIMQGTETINKTLEGRSKDFDTALETYGNAVAALNVLKTDPNNAYAQNELARSFAMALNKGAFSDKDAAVGMSASGWADLKKKAESWVNGEKTVLNPSELKNIAYMYQSLIQNQLTQQLLNESQIKESALQYGPGLVDMKALRFPSQKYYAINNTSTGLGNTSQGSNSIINTSQGSAPPQAIMDTINNPKLLPQFVQKYGYDPSKPREQ